jgi:Lysylphosphatidylglycerol synthase TM region
MLDRIASAYRAAAHAGELLVDHAARVDVWWLGAGLAIHLVAQAVRTRGWFNIIRAAYPHAQRLRARDTVAAYFAGAGLNGVLPARGGDVLKLYLVHRRIEGARYATLAATFVPETLFETACGAALVAWALTQGFLPVPLSASDIPALDVSLVIAHPFLSAAGAAALAGGGWMGVRRLRRRGRDLLERVRRGMAILGRPDDFLSGVVTWQLLGRIIRLGSLACFMQAFGLPVTAASVVLVMAAQGGGRLIPIAPVSAGLRLAMLSYGFVEITGRQVDIASITAFTFGVGTVILVSGVAISAAILARTFRTLSPSRAVAAARAALAQYELPRLRRAER